MKKIVWLLMVLMLAGTMPVLFADGEGVAGCAGIAVDPSLSLEMQQAVCNAGEGQPGTSCASSGAGICSSPKLNDTLPEAGHCICISEEVLAEDVVA